MVRSRFSILTFGSAVLLLGAASACSDDDEASKGANNDPNGPFVGIDAAVGASGKCPHDVSPALGTPVHGITIPQEHPRLWWTPDRIARAKTWLASHPIRPKEDYILHAFLHVVDGADCKAAIDWVMDFEISDSSFNVASNEMRWSGEQAILTYDWCYDQLTADQRSTLLTRWSGYIERAKGLSFGGPDMPSNNYYWGYLRNEIMWGIATYGEDPKAEEILSHGLVTRWEQSFLPFAAGTGNGDGRGGLPQEGTQYGTYMTSYPIMPFVSASLLGRTLYDETEFFKGTVFYLIYATTPAKTTGDDGRVGFEIFPFNDDESWHNANTARDFSDFMAQAAQTWDCLPVGKYARAWTTMVEADPVAYIASVDKGGETLDIQNLPLDYYAAGPRYYYGRSAWGPKATVFHWQLGDYESAGVGHHHYDYGSFQIWRGGRWLSRESAGYTDKFTGFGGEGEEDSSMTLAHNTILVNGKGFARPSSDGVEGPPVVRRLESAPEYAYANVDLSKAYRNGDRNHPERDNPAVAHVERELVFLRQLETTVIFDRIVSNAVDGTSADQIQKTFLAHFEQNPTIEDATHVTATNGDQALRLTVLVPSAPQTRVINEKEADNARQGQYRLEVNTSGAALSYFLTVLQGKDASAPALAPTVTDGGSTFTVTLDGSTSIVFQKGETSTGGTVTIGGVTKNLRADAQGMVITDEGPAWQ